jgi:ADP-sugar diphosphatase
LLRGDAVAILVALYCDDGDEAYALLVDQPRVPIGNVSTLELPAGMLDGARVAGAAVQELQEECGIEVRTADLVDLTALACQEASLPVAAIPPSPGGCDEFIRCMYLEKKVTRRELQELQGRLTGLRDDGEYISLRVVPLQDVWKVSGDAKAMM